MLSDSNARGSTARREAVSLYSAILSTSASKNAGARALGRTADVPYCQLTRGTGGRQPAQTGGRRWVAMLRSWPILLRGEIWDSGFAIGFLEPQLGLLALASPTVAFCSAIICPSSADGVHAAAGCALV